MFSPCYRLSCNDILFCTQTPLCAFIRTQAHLYAKHAKQHVRSYTHLNAQWRPRFTSKYLKALLGPFLKRYISSKHGRVTACPKFTVIFRHHFHSFRNNQFRRKRSTIPCRKRGIIWAELGKYTYFEFSMKNC